MPKIVDNYSEILSTMNGSIRQPKNQPIHTRVVSHTPGRVRLKVLPNHWHDGQIEQIANELRSHPDISEVRINDKTGSIIVHHECQRYKVKDVFSILRDVGIIVGTVTMGKSEAAQGVSNAVTDLNQRFARATNGLVDLRFLLPVGFAAMSARQLLVKGLQLDIIPWYVLAWYSFDSFIKLHYTKDPQQKNDYQPTGHRDR